MSNAIRDELSHKVAQSLVAEFSDGWDQVLVEHQYAMECRDCEDFLSKGLKAFRFIASSDEMLREADVRGISDYSQREFDAMTSLYREWLETSTKAGEWIARIAQFGHSPDNLHEFEKTREAAAAILEDREWLKSSRAAFDEHTPMG